ncbi:MAG TPA: acetyl/propionyl/methylcrotonyl-CoA carboxylase subunit alpha [Ideonella sp.]|uniref:acetyl/propionyl/methylcrotonyl-CoA carboxylase subunit alpha n=1 Tax=Ideonella sp. TaxID=1929293 RepID=UPI002BB7C8FC|nr:acetyl/propionyl/methylcrotonyl-CoA carboxylase subunit alpha [Ideonella sp.]HSI50498.1 acetyl/propionyl/methylcrotonyl-CoA carboxylase subunit alpha [Ideonella sp.]
MFKKILIANRGEIACRVIKTAKKMGIATVAVYSEADKEARHVALADEAVLLGPAPSRESYLVADKIIAAAKATGADAIHPGYGFLSENEAFARRVEEEGLVFIGPKHYSIAAMGDKIASKKLAKEANVSTIPGWNEAIDTPEQAVEIARGVGYPVMIKASAGGGGKGLRVAFNDKEAFEGFSSCRNEARNSFGDDRVFIEKFVEEPRHIEIQVLGDSQGNAVFLWERECSIQRRHQKVIEEAPSPFISEATRQAMGAQAVQLAKAVKYQSAGTVEFVVGKDQSFYFLEMNTRLQVEHPVTECITGLDLVEQMIRVAAGEPLGFTQADLKREGWAIECRINAEDPFRNFLPSTGRLVRYQPPATTLEAGMSRVGPSTGSGRTGSGVAEMSVGAANPLSVRAEPVEAQPTYGVRVDTGVYEGGEIPMFYDSMIAKLIVHGRDRLDAIAKMREALNAFVIRGISSNIPFQAALLAHPKFVAGDFNTGFIAEHYGHGFRAEDVPHDDPLFLVALAAFVRRKARERAAGITGQLQGHDVAHADELVVVQLGEQGSHVHHAVRLGEFGALKGTLDVTVSGKTFVIQSDTKLGEVLMTGTVNGKPFSAQVERGPARLPLALRVSHNGTAIDALALLPRAAELLRLMPYKAPPDLSKFLLSPMPGLLAEVSVAVGQKVLAGEKLAVIEAMKMENILVATQDGVVKDVLAKKGDSLAVDQSILAFE